MNYDIYASASYASVGKASLAHMKKGIHLMDFLIDRHKGGSIIIVLCRKEGDRYPCDKAKENMD